LNPLQLFATIKKNMIEEKGENIGSGSTTVPDVTTNERVLLKFEFQLREEILPAKRILENKLNEMVKRKGREKWSSQFQKL
jgi:hypothetical protein